MRVQKVHVDSVYEFAPLDDEGLAIPIVSNFLGYLRARGVRRTPLVPTRTTCGTSISSSKVRVFGIRTSLLVGLWIFSSTSAWSQVAAKCASIRQT